MPRSPRFDYDDPDDTYYERSLEDKWDQAEREAEQDRALLAAESCAPEGLAVQTLATLAPVDHEDARCPNCTRRTARGELCPRCASDLTFPRPEYRT